MKIQKVIEDLEGATRQLDVELRRETGDFRGGRCTVDGSTVILLNKRHPPEVHLAVLAESLRDLPVDTVYLKPSVRAALEEEWERLDLIENAVDREPADREPANREPLGREPSAGE